MYYSAIGNSGFTNQIFSLITSILLAYKSNHKVVVVDAFSNDISKNISTPISEIFNLEKMNRYLQSKYKIVLVDKYKAKFEVSKILYGMNGQIVDLTDYCKTTWSRKNGVFIDKSTDFNTIKGDPCPGIYKVISIYYTVDAYHIDEHYDETLFDDISIDFLNSTYIHTFKWIEGVDATMFEDILSHIEYTDEFVEKSQTILQKIISTNTINSISVVHLRLEDDAIQHWSRQNHMTESSFKRYIESKYTGIIQKYCKKDDFILILSSSLENSVLDFLIQNDYRFTMVDKFYEDREKNAIVDLLVSKACNSIYIGNYNPIQQNGSSFSYYVGKLMGPGIKKISIDLDRIYQDEGVSY